MFYAEYARYGIRVINGRTLYRFKTKKERDAWIAADKFENDYHRAPITREEARRKHYEGFSALHIGFDANWVKPWNEYYCDPRERERERERAREYPSIEMLMTY